jgi:hypothetical protein
MTVRCKFRCIKNVAICADVREVEFEVVTSGPGNESWSRWTPSGSLKMSITNPDAYDQFKVGEEYFVNLVPSNPVYAPPGG